ALSSPRASALRPFVPASCLYFAHSAVVSSLAISVVSQSIFRRSRACLVVQTSDLRAEHWRMRDDCGQHARLIEIESELDRAIALCTAVESRRAFADVAKLRRILQTNIRWHRHGSRGLRELRISRALSSRANDDARFCAQCISTDIPILCRGAEEHRARLRAEFTILLKRVRDRT